MTQRCHRLNVYLEILVNLQTEFVGLGGDPVEFDNLLEESCKLTLSQESICRWMFHQALHTWYTDAQIEDLLPSVTQMVHRIEDFGEFERQQTIDLVLEEVSTIPRKERRSTLYEICGKQIPLSCNRHEEQGCVVSGLEISTRNRNGHGKGIFIEYPDFIEDKADIEESGTRRDDAPFKRTGVKDDLMHSDILLPTIIVTLTD